MEAGVRPDLPLLLVLDRDSIDAAQYKVSLEAQWRSTSSEVRWCNTSLPLADALRENTHLLGWLVGWLVGTRELEE